MAKKSKSTPDGPTDPGEAQRALIEHEIAATGAVSEETLEAMRDEAARLADEAPAPVVTTPDGTADVELPEPEVNQEDNDAGKLQLTPAETLALHSLCRGTDIVEVRAMASTSVVNLQTIGFIDEDGVPTDAGREYIGSC